MQNTSLKKNLIIKLTALILLMLTAVCAVSFFNSKKEISAIFDADMIKSARLIFGVIKDDSFVENTKNIDDELNQKFLNRYDYEIHIQVWKKDSIIYNSGEKIKVQKPDYEGFKDIFIENEQWRSFVLSDQKSQITILILEKYHIRKELIEEIIFSLIAPFLISLIPLLLVIVSVVKSELKPLKLLAEKISEISSLNLKKFKTPKMPVELKPFLDSFNSLLSRLDESIEAEKRFTDYAAHELNTPLTAIKIQAQILASNSNEQEKQEYLDDLLKGIDRASHLVSQLLILSRLSSDNKNFSKEKFIFADLIQCVVENFRGKNKLKSNALTTKNIDFVCEQEALIKLVNANKTYIEILLNNVIDNAIKYSFGDKLIKISLEQKSDFLVLKVDNQGEEISAHDIKQIFQNFYRNNKSEKTRNIAGSGLGLAISRKIVELHNGLITFKSHQKINSVIIQIPAIH